YVSHKRPTRFLDVAIATPCQFFDYSQGFHGQSLCSSEALSAQNQPTRLRDEPLFLAAVHFAHAQQPKKIPRIGYLSSLDPVSESTRSEAIRRSLRELGYIEGQNIAIEYRYAEGKWDRLPELAAELVRLKVDIILAGVAPLALAAKNATKTIPIVMTGAGLDPVEAGLVESLARPGGNITGITNVSLGLGGKRLELLKEAVPKLARVAVLYELANPASVTELKVV